MSSTITISAGPSIELQARNPTSPLANDKEQVLGSSEFPSATEQPPVQASLNAENTIELSNKRAAVVITTVAGVNFLNTMGSALIIFRGFQGLSISLCLTTAVGIISTSFPPTSSSNRRNFAFAATGAASPVGYTIGLVLGGAFVQSVGWRWSFYFATILNVILTGMAMWSLPADANDEAARGSMWKRLGKEIDWIGAAIATVSISMLSYVLAIITGSASNIREVQNIILLTIALLLIPVFIYWMHRKEHLNRPAVIPNSIWKQSAFTTTCIVVFLTWGAFNPFGYFTTLFFQEIQTLSPLQTSLRFLPTVVCGFLTNVVTALLVRKTSASYLVAISSVFSALACVLMAIVKPEWSYWAVAFPAVFLSPMSSDVLYTISNLIITSSFPPTKQSLAGGVFNTVSQIGNSVGLIVGAVIAASVSSSSTSNSYGRSGKLANSDEYVLLNGYRATFYACFAAMALVAVGNAHSSQNDRRLETRRKGEPHMMKDLDRALTTGPKDHDNSRQKPARRAKFVSGEWHYYPSSKS
ncbi:hypothetical protein VTL71DRAFT_8283 [Oculimacula yallundae]|uniref:Major facilitator superfamily (MFS) profile domain-containing protein n=1 Tax=Oculimacula yallundae TaxID=86028 RepID=A0ABR4CX84_9HELO